MAAKIGYSKIDFLLAEHGEAVIVMRVIKKAIDPDNTMNPGKILRIQPSQMSLSFVLFIFRTPNR
jgi:hypothetical protein